MVTSISRNPVGSNLGYQCRLASLVAKSTFHIGLLLSLGQSYRVTCHQRFLPWFLESWRRHSCTFWRMIAGRNLGYRAVDTRSSSREVRGGICYQWNAYM